MLTMRPKPRVFMPSHTALLTLKQEPRLVSITASHMSRLRRRIVLSRVMPALLTTISIGPRYSSLGAGGAADDSAEPRAQRPGAIGHDVDRRDAAQQARRRHRLAEGRGADHPDDRSGAQQEEAETSQERRMDHGRERHDAGGAEAH